MSAAVQDSARRTGRTLAAGNRFHALPRPHRARGFTLIVALLALFLLSLATQGVMTYVSQQAQRDRERMLVRIGNAYAAAIGSYYESSPGTVKRWPASLDDLLEDRRQVALLRHLREIHPDPMTRSKTWGLVPAPDGGIAGVYSLSDARPILEAGTPAVSYGTGRISDRRFIYTPGAPSAGIQAR